MNDTESAMIDAIQFAIEEIEELLDLDANGDPIGHDSIVLCRTLDALKASLPRP